MDVIRYIQAADLHLDTPFQGLSREAAQGSHLASLLHEATFTALERLFRLCEAERPDFVVLAGDIYNQENYSVKAQLRLRDGCERLGRLGIVVFLAHGNHDPLDSRLNAVNWPENVTVFGATPEQHVVLDRCDHRLLAVVHGISHTRAKEGRDLARLFKRDTSHDCFQLGVLHCTVDGGTKANCYAPCTLEDLRASGLDAWALGHVHERRVLSQQPFAAYPGNMQGLHINEPGPRGCLLVTAEPHGRSFVCSSTFHVLGPVRWENSCLELDGMEHLDEVERRLGQCLENLADGVDAECEAIIARVTLTGRTSLDATLREAATQEDLAECLRHFNSGTPGVWLKDLRVQTCRLTDRSDYLRREDLLGEAMRLCQRMNEDPKGLRSMADSALNLLYAHNRLRRALTRPDDQQIQNLLQEAERLCMDLLEAR